MEKTYKGLSPCGEWRIRTSICRFIVGHSAVELTLRSGHRAQQKQSNLNNNSITTHKDARCPLEPCGVHSNTARQIVYQARRIAPGRRSSFGIYLLPALLRQVARRVLPPLGGFSCINTSKTSSGSLSPCGGEVSGPVAPGPPVKAAREKTIVSFPASAGAGPGASPGVWPFGCREPPRGIIRTALSRRRVLVWFRSVS